MKDSLFSVPVKVRYYDTDLSRAVYFTNYIKWFDSIALPDFTDALGIDWRSLLEQNLDAVIAHVSFDYKAPCYLDDVVDIHITDVDLGNTSMTIYGSLYKDGTLVAEGKMVYVIVDYTTRRPVPIPGFFKEKMEAHIRTKKEG
ncbi:MAG: acyl-CoA thioesterase [Firmicutes bacterium]|jgi:YbgC/YbaW family acyl-CoA thioester hydrolase|nr:acyl-CoA thioesterase [Bacillota bacterium]HPU01870.1 thioesterase family protein [Bacillota bacterium]HPZ65670.1 thioesterase family protein [Bacillota bacterium]